MSCVALTLPEFYGPAFSQCVEADMSTGRIHSKLYMNENRCGRGVSVVKLSPLAVACIG